MKIAIITLPGNFNYGNRLQNYALQYALENKGYIVETLVPIDKKKNKLKLFIFESLGTLKSILLLRYSKRKLNKESIKKMKDIKEKKISPFTDEYIKSVLINDWSEENMLRINNMYDYFVVGSDQVWNPNYINNYDFYFARFADNNKKVSYAASFGIQNIPEKYNEIYISGLAGFSTITVREQSGARIIKKLVGKESNVVLDPTLLISPKEWLEFVSETSIEQFSYGEKYVLTYFLGSQTQEYFKAINSFANEYNLKVINIMGNYFFDDFIVPDPKEFLRLINDAEYVFTDSFHAVVFSLIYHTNFISFERGDMNSRITTLLNTCGIEDIERDRPIVGDKINSQIREVDFNNVDAKLSFHSKISKTALYDLFNK